MIKIMVLNFILGFSVPLVARRIIKAFPSDAGTSLAYSMKPRVKTINIKHWKKYSELNTVLMLLCLIYALIMANTALFFATYSNIDAGWIAVFLWLSFVLMEIDRRVMLLPDILTSPLLILGFAFAVFNPETISPLESAVGAMFGYFMPMLCAFIMTFKKPESLGGGDIKAMAALGAWLGIYLLSIALVVSFVIFLGIMIVKRERAGPYGPALFIAAIVTLMLSNIEPVMQYFKW